MNEHFNEETESFIITDKLKQFHATLNYANNLDDLQPESLPVNLESSLSIKLVQSHIILQRHIDLNQVKYTLRAINVVPAVLEVATETRVLDLSILKSIEQVLSHSTYDIQDYLNDYNIISRFLIFEVSIYINVANLWDDKPNAVNEEHLRNQSLSLLKLPINYFLNGFLLEEIMIGLIKAKQFS